VSVLKKKKKKKEQTVNHLIPSFTIMGKGGVAIHIIQHTTYKQYTTT